MAEPEVQEKTIEQKAANNELGFYLEEDSDEAPVVEEKAEPAQKEEQPKEEEIKLSAAFEELAKKDREILERTKALKDAEERYKKYEDLKNLAGQDPDKVLEAFGVDPIKYLYAKYTADEKPAEEPKPSKEIEELRARLAQFEEAQQRQSFQQRMDYELGTIRKTASDLSEKFPTVALSLNQKNSTLANDILEAAAMEYQKTGQKPEYADLIERAEELLEEQILTAVTEAIKVDKYRTKLGELFGNKSQIVNDLKKNKTLSNDMTGEVNRVTRELSKDEREKEARRILKSAWVEDEPEEE